MIKKRSRHLSLSWIEWAKFLEDKLSKLIQKMTHKLARLTFTKEIIQILCNLFYEGNHVHHMASPSNISGKKVVTLCEQLKINRHFTTVRGSQGLLNTKADSMTRTKSSKKRQAS